MKIIDSLLYSITNHLPARIINDGERPYLERYYVGTLFGWRFYLHRFVDSDPNRGLHDHPWRKARSIILSGWYWEETRVGMRKVCWFNSLTGDSFHRVVLPKMMADYTCYEQGHQRIGEREGDTPAPCWTLFFHTAGNVKPWGFLKKLPGDINSVFYPYTYAREGSQVNWWLTAPNGREVRKAARA